MTPVFGCIYCKVIPIWLWPQIKSACRLEWPLTWASNITNFWLVTNISNVATFGNITNFLKESIFSSGFLRCPFTANAVRYRDLEMASLLSNSRNSIPTNPFKFCSLVVCINGPVQYDCWWYLSTSVKLLENLLKIACVCATVCEVMDSDFWPYFKFWRRHSWTL